MLLVCCDQGATSFTIPASACLCFTITFRVSVQTKTRIGANRAHAAQIMVRTIGTQTHIPRSIFEIRMHENTFYASTCQPQLELKEQCEEMFNCIDFVKFEDAYLCAKK